MKTKLLLIVLSIMFFPCAIFAQTATESTFVVDLGTFTGAITLVSFLVTQIAKLIDYIDKHKWAKILASVVVGILVCLASWATGFAAFLEGMEVWQVILYGVGAGLSGCGFYDIVKPVLALFTKKDKEE